MPTAIPRPGYTSGQPFEDWLNAQLQQNPGYVLPKGWKNEHGRAVRDTHSGLQDAIMYGAPAVGFGVAGGLGAASALSGGAGAGAAAASAAPTASALPGASAGGFLAGGGATGASSLLSKISPWLNLTGQVLPLASSLFSKGGSNSTPMDAELQKLLAMQNSRMAQSEPLYQAILKMAMGLMPTSAQPQAARPTSPTATPQGGGTMPPARPRF